MEPATSMASLKEKRGTGTSTFRAVLKTAMYPSPHPTAGAAEL